MIGSTQQVARILFEKLGADAGPQGQDRLLDRHARAALDPPRARDRRRDRGVARVLEAAEHVPRPAAVAARTTDGRLHTTFNQAVASTGPALDDEPEPAGDPDPHRPRPRDPQRLRRRAGPPAAVRRLLADRAADPRARLAASRSCARRSSAARTSTRATAAEVLGVEPAKLTSAQRSDREDDQLRDRLRHLGVRPLGEPRDPARGGAGVHRRVPRALPARAGLHRADDRAGDARRLRDVAARPAPAGARDPRVEPRRRARSASGSRSTSSCRARTPTSSRSR